MGDPIEDRPPEPGDDLADDGRAEPLRWARAQLSAQGIRRLLAGIARLLRWIRPLGLLAALIGGTGIVAGALLVPHDRVIAIVVVVLSIPAVIAPLLVRHHLGLLATSLEHPEEMAAQARDLASGLRMGPELAAMFERDRSRHESGDGRFRRLRRSFRTLRSVSAVVGAARPDADRHPLLVPFSPARLGRLWTLLGWSLLSVPLAGFAIALAAITGLLSAL